MGVETGSVAPAGGSSASTKSKPSKSSIRTLPLGAPGWLHACDEPARAIIRTLAANPYARLVILAYVFLLHVWVIVVMQMADASPRPEEVIPPADGLVGQGPLLEVIEE